MIIHFKYSYNEPSTKAIVSESISGIVNKILFQEKVFEVADMVNTEIFFEIGNSSYPLSKMKNITFITESADKINSLEKSELNGFYKLNGASYATLEELYYDLKELL